MGTKLDRLLPDHQILVVHPIAASITLVRPGMDDRRSPKRGHVHDVLDELVSIPSLLDHPNFTLEVVMVEERRLKVHDASLRRRRGGWRTVDRQLVDVVSTHRFDSPADIAELLPSPLPDVFTTADIARASRFSKDVAQKLAYCLRACEIIEVTDRTKAGYHYRMT
jgi:hypothetical protein